MRSRFQRNLLLALLLTGVIVQGFAALGVLYIVGEALRPIAGGEAAYLRARDGIIALEVLVLALVTAASLNISQHLAAPLGTIRRGLEMMLGANPDHRIKTASGDEFETLAQHINTLADRSITTKSSLESEVTKATRSVAFEREKLASVLFALSEGVVVCDDDLTVVLCNRAAQDILTGGMRPASRGTSIFGYLDAPRLRPLIEAAELSGGETRRGTLTLSGGTVVEVQIVAMGENGHRNWVLLLREIARSPRHDRQPFSRVDPASDTVGKQLASLLGDGSFYDFDYKVRRDAAVGDHAAAKLRDLSFVVMDLETTGLRPRDGDEIISIAGVRISGLEIIREDHFYNLVNPRRPIPPASTRVHGITDSMVADQPALDEVIPRFIGFQGNSLLAGHFVSFDLSFLEPRAAVLGTPLRSEAWLDTLLLSHALLTDLEEFNLEDIAGHLGIPIVARHTALGDAYITAEVLIRLFKLMEAKGIDTLGGALRLQERRLLGGFL